VSNGGTAVGDIDVEAAMLEAARGLPDLLKARREAMDGILRRQLAARYS
jgi:hypothetical protein